METISLSSQEAVAEVRLKSPDIPPAREGGVCPGDIDHTSISGET